MAAVNVFLGTKLGKASGVPSSTTIRQGTSTTAGDFIELRVLTQNSSDVLTNVTNLDVVRALKMFIMHIMQGGANFAGTALPLPGPKG